MLRVGAAVRVRGRSRTDGGADDRSPAALSTGARADRIISSHAGFWDSQEGWNELFRERREESGL